MKRFLPIVLLLLISAPVIAQEKRFTIPIDNSPSSGRADAPVTLVEFIDFQ